VKLLDGKLAAAEIKKELTRDVAAIQGRKPAIALVRVGEDPASRVYVGTKAKASEEIGIVSRGAHLDANVTEDTLLGTLRDFNNDDDVDGILLQLPLPKHLDSDKAIATISPEKDVDGFHPESLGRLAAGNPRFVPCTPLGIRELLIRNGVKTAGANVVVLGRSVIVGKPMSLLFSLKGEGGDATVTICHSRSRDLAEHTRRADIIVAAMGVPQFLKADMVRDGVVVVDVGINRVDDASTPKGYRIVGDVDFDRVAPRCSLITPVPGGVGPMTVAMLMSNTLAAFRLRQAGHVVR
jgi:methylenetetrahydrofolate dehydrogenase (NADP+)/methenyltetrahydrofolate cyclohydrolase